MEILFTSIIGFLLGIFASWSFWKYLLWHKPKINISKKISLETNKETGTKILRFKIYNNGKNTAVDVNIKVWVCNLISVPGNIVSKAITKLIVENENCVLGTRNTKNTAWDLQPYFTFTATSEIDVLDLLSKKDHRILVEFSATDSLTGTIDVQQLTFKRTDIVVDGKFSADDNMEILQP